uniref:C1q domain-containing protein n=1 Tax=Pinctada fucata TaxID=50426 RepID=A0A194AN60_PINFU
MSTRIQTMKFLLIIVIGQYIKPAEMQSDVSTRLTILENIVGHLLTGEMFATNDTLANISAASIAKKSKLLQISPREAVVFSAHRSGGVSGLSSGFIVKFDSIVTNIGGHYYPADGIFIAPVRGVYLFHWQIILCDTNRVYTEIRVSGMTKGKSYSDDQLYDTTANMVILEVKEHQHVWIQTSSSSVCINDYSSFAGTLLIPF